MHIWKENAITILSRVRNLFNWWGGIKIVFWYHILIFYSLRIFHPGLVDVKCHSASKLFFQNFPLILHVFFFVGKLCSLMSLEIGSQKVIRAISAKIFFQKSKPITKENKPHEDCRQKLKTVLLIDHMAVTELSLKSCLVQPQIGVKILLWE